MSAPDNPIAALLAQWQQNPQINPQAAMTPPQGVSAPQAGGGIDQVLSVPPPMGGAPGAPQMQPPVPGMQAPQGGAPGIDQLLQGGPPPTEDEQLSRQMLKKALERGDKDQKESEWVSNLMKGMLTQSPQDFARGALGQPKGVAGQMLQNILGGMAAGPNWAVMKNQRLQLAQQFQQSKLQELGQMIANRRASAAEQNALAQSIMGQQKTNALIERYQNQSQTDKIKAEAAQQNADTNAQKSGRIVKDGNIFEFPDGDVTGPVKITPYSSSKERTPQMAEMMAASRAAVTAWNQSHPGQEKDVSTIHSFVDVPVDALPQAAINFKQFAGKPGDDEVATLRKLQIQKEGLQISKLQKDMQENGTDAVQGAIDALKENKMLWISPEFQGIIKSAKIGPQVMNGYRSQTGNVLPNHVSATELTAADQAEITKVHVTSVRQLVQDPRLAALLGPLTGRFVKAGTAIGSPIGVDPAIAEKEQELQTALTYLFMREGKALFGGRPPQQLMADLQKNSPDIRMVQSLFSGALNRVETAAKQQLGVVNKALYGQLSYQQPTGSGPIPPTGGGITKPKDKDGQPKASMRWNPVTMRAEPF